LLAPTSGRQMRHGIANKVKALSNKAASNLNEGKAKVRAIVERASSKAEEVRDQGVDVLGDIARQHGAAQSR
jgi:gas vesicle protein